MISRRSFITGTGALLASTQVPTQTVGKTLNEADVIVVGAGGAGLAAAVAAAEKGASVIVLEKMSAPGGNTLRSSGSFNAAIASANHDDSPQKHYLDTFRYGGCRADPELVRTLTENAPEALAWLQSQGVRFSEHVYQAFGGMHPRAHNTLAPFGAGYIEALLARCRSLNISILTDHQVLDFHKNSSNRVTGVRVLHNGQKIDFAAHRAVVAASGGFAADNDMCSIYDPRVDRMPTTNHPGATGEVLRALENIGASLVGMDYIELAPVCLVGKDVFETISPVGTFIFIDSDGNRFVDEMSTHEIITEAFMAKPDGRIFSLMDERGRMSLKDDVRAAFDAHVKNGNIFREKTLEDLAIRIEVPVENLKKSAQALCSDFKGKRSKLEPPFYSTRMKLAVHYTMGGVRINSKANVLDRSGRVIEGLFAAGEVTGGIHGSNRLGGNGIADAFVFGRIAGINAPTFQLP